MFKIGVLRLIWSRSGFVPISTSLFLTRVDPRFLKFSRSWSELVLDWSKFSGPGPVRIKTEPFGPRPTGVGPFISTPSYISKRENFVDFF